MLIETSKSRTKIEAMLETKTFNLSNSINLVILIEFNWYTNIKLSIYVIVLTIKEV